MRVTAKTSTLETNHPVSVPPVTMVRFFTFRVKFPFMDKKINLQLSSGLKPTVEKQPYLTVDFSPLLNPVDKTIQHYPVGGRDILCRYSVQIKIMLGLLMSLILVACNGQQNSPTAPTATTNPFPRMRVIVSEAMVFAHPSREADVLFRLIEGDQMTVLARTEADGLGVPWYQVGQGEEFGWIAGSQVEVSGDLSRVRVAALYTPPTTPLATEVIPTLTPVPETVQATVRSVEALIYPQPDATLAEVMRLPQGETADIIGRMVDESGTDTFFFLGRNRTPLGWVQAVDVTVSGDISTVATVADALSSALPTEVSNLITPEATSTTAPLTEASPTPGPTLMFTATVTSTSTPAVTADLASTSQAAPTATDFPVDPSVPTMTPAPFQRGEAPPLQITLPDGWEAAHALVNLNTAYIQGNLPVSLYTGPLENGATGTIWLIWGYPNVTDPISQQINPYADGVQLLRGLVVDAENCTMGLGSERRQYKIGGLDAVGTIYSASPCLDGSDVAGFFAAMHLYGMNFAFFVEVEPVAQVGPGLREMQTILDSVQFDEEILQP